MESDSGVRVVSVIGDLSQPPASVLAAAHQLAPLIAGLSPVDRIAARELDLFDLPLADGHAWSVHEELEQQIATPGALVTRYTSYLPAPLAAWTGPSPSSDSQHDPGMAVRLAPSGLLHQAIRAHRSD